MSIGLLDLYSATNAFIINGLFGIGCVLYESMQYYHRRRIKRLIEKGLITLEINKIIFDIERGLK